MLFCKLKNTNSISCSKKKHEKIICGNFVISKSLHLLKDFIINREDGNPKLIEQTDEFFGQKNIYLSGPSVRHDGHIFCFIYKFRQRFGVIVEDILRKEEHEEKKISSLVERWKVNGMYLSDLSCCGDECIC